MTALGVAPVGNALKGRLPSCHSSTLATGPIPAQLRGLCQGASTQGTTKVGILLPAGVLVAASSTNRRGKFRPRCHLVARRVEDESRSMEPRKSTALKRRRPRWAPGGSAIVEKRTPVEIMDDMVEETLPGNGKCYRVIYDNGVGLRFKPRINSKRTGEDLVKGEVFEIRTEVRRAGRSYFELMDGRGWAFDWLEIDGQRMQLVEEAATLYTVVFPDGVYGLKWKTDTTWRFTSMGGFATSTDALNLAPTGIAEDDILVLIDEDPVVGMPLGKVLERIWATSGRQPGNGLHYRVVTKGAYGIGIRTEPDVAGPRTGDDLIRGDVFEVDDVVQIEGEPLYLRLADGRGWVFDTSTIDPENPSVQNIADVDPGCTLTFWRGSADELARTIGVKFDQDGLGSGLMPNHTITVLEEGQPVQRIEIEPGSNLRKVLVDNNFQVYDNLRNLFHCNAKQLCGTCVLNVVDGMDNLTVMSVNEQRVMKQNPDSFRLCCNADVYGDVTVQLRPPNVVYGGGTS
eukprot:CAMPEP_0172719878 /NCGR_PEP_ID=MMETSP1074-20121228/75758_1 /TAXON_ID=2916 /ORGANISM="Ceratium fusus, Strain PA161109" /LENGTH=513 /DNA_ID=CAMNT_0013545277 /DNA_START=63 /DNA_END=1604 /DNA_ORIENTATION=-